MMDTIKIKNVSKNFRFSSNPFAKKEEFFALKNISLHVKKGEFLGIIGPNGAGKSTLLRIITGILKPSAGNVKIEGDLLSFIELGIGMNEELTGRENVYLYGSLLGLGRKKIEANLESVIRFSGIGEFFEKKLKTYSTGMKIRLAFSVAALSDPSILIIDEILAVGDEEFQEKSISHIKYLNEKGTTIILVSHDMQRIIELCNRAVFLKEGRIEYAGDPDEAVYRYLKYVNEKEKFVSIHEFEEELNSIRAMKSKGKKTNLYQKVKSLIGREKGYTLEIADKESRLKKRIESEIDILSAELMKLKKEIAANDLFASRDLIRKKINLVEKRYYLVTKQMALTGNKDLEKTQLELLREEINDVEVLQVANAAIIQESEDLKEIARLKIENTALKKQIQARYQLLDSHIPKENNGHFIRHKTGFGSRKAIFTKVRFIGKNKEETSIFYTGEPFTA